jgi:hypothetical protein
VSAFPTPSLYGKNQKVEFKNLTTNGADKGFDRLGWAPEGYVFFNYAIGYNLPLKSQFTATATADIDADGTIQVWGYTKGGVAAKTGHTCLIGTGGLTPPETVGPCLAAFGQSVF